MARIQDAFSRAAEQRRAAFVAYLCAGDPDFDTSLAACRAVIASGADILELGVPFSDPLADGLTNQLAAQRALKAGMTAARVFELVRRIRESSDVPIVFYTYYNLVFSNGVEAYVAAARAAGVDGLLILDLPPEEAGEAQAACRRHGVDTVCIVAPTTPDSRLPRIAAAATGFIYYVSREGVTGVRDQLAGGIKQAVARIRAHTGLPVAVGFGISTREQVSKVSALADGVVVGSALVNVIRDGLGALAGIGPSMARKVTELSARNRTNMTRILVIDDDRLQFRLVQQHFKNFQQGSYELEWSETYEDGLAKLLTGNYAACLLDYRLGERDGLQLIREAAAAGCRTPIVFLTAESSDNIDIQAMEAGALDYLVKGEISPRSLERSLRYALKLGDTLEALRRLATRDELTGLLNRREYDRVLAEEEDRAERFGNSLALVVIDLDRFKFINDMHGHPAGDAVLREAARRIAGVIRTVDRAARIGGEEFALILVQTDRAGALEVARRAIASVAMEPIRVGDGHSLSVTASAGVAELPTDAREAGQLFAAADKALYAAKAQGRNRAILAGEAQGTP